MAEQLMFADREAFRQWLLENHHTNTGIWLIFSKCGNITTLKADEALEEALCFGWIDGQIQSINEEKYIKKFTPRRKGSKWSGRNKEIVNRLLKDGKVTQAGIKAIDAAKRTGNWDPPPRATVLHSQIEIFTEALRGAEPALSNFLKMPPSVKRTYTGFYFDAKKEETRINRLKNIIWRLNENKKPMG